MDDLLRVHLDSLKHELGHLNVDVHRRPTQRTAQLLDQMLTVVEFVAVRQGQLEQDLAQITARLNRDLPKRSPE